MNEPTVHLWRPGLVTARKRKGWSQEEAAAAIGVSPTTWARWERGEQGVRMVYRAQIAERFNVTLEEVASWIDERAEGQCMPWLSVGKEPCSLAATVEAVGELWKWDADPSRRDVLMALPFVPAVLSEWLLSWGLDPGADDRSRSAPGRSVGIEDVHRLREAVDAFATMDHQYGGGLVRPAITDYLHNEVAPLLKGTYSDDIGGQLMTASALMTGLAGWEAYDLSRNGLAQAHYGQALRLAKAADDPLTSAWVLTMLAQQAIDLKHPGPAVRLARAGRFAGQHAGACPRVRAQLLLREARATALTTELADTPDPYTAARVERLLGEVDEVFAKASASDDEPDWVHDLGRAEISAEAGCAWRMIGQYKRAEEHADMALRGFDARRTRSRQFNLIHRAEALLGQGELDAAVASARQAVPMATALTSTRSLKMVRSFDRRLNAYAGESPTQEWREYLRTVLPAAA